MTARSFFPFFNCCFITRSSPSLPWSLVAPPHHWSFVFISFRRQHPIRAADHVKKHCKKHAAFSRARRHNPHHAHSHPGALSNHQRAPLPQWPLACPSRGAWPHAQLPGQRAVRPPRPPSPGSPFANKHNAASTRPNRRAAALVEAAESSFGRFWESSPSDPPATSLW